MAFITSGATVKAVHVKSNTAIPKSNIKIQCRTKNRGKTNDVVCLSLDQHSNTKVKYKNTNILQTTYRPNSCRQKKIVILY